MGDQRHLDFSDADPRPRAKKKRSSKQGGGEKKGPRGSAYERAVKLLARRQQSVSELRRKLRERGFEARDIEEAMARLEELNYTDDERAAFDWAEELARRGGMGRRKAETKLVQRGIDPELARRALGAAWDGGLERDHARRVLGKLLRSDPGLPKTAKGRAKLGRSLASRGFEGEVIGDILRRLEDEARSGG